jgi:membrane fusion protein, heavy metal efflux system
MRTRIAIVLAVLVASTGCGSCFGRPVPAPVPVPDKAAEKTASHSNELEVAEDMLRDLRLTTAEVQGAKSVESFATIPGELKVNEDAYAEIAAPLPGRVTRLLAGVGDRVQQGGPLAELQSAELGRARAAVMAASSRVTLARSVLDRKRALAAERIAPEREVQEAEAELAASQAEAAAADASVRALGAAPEDAGGTSGAARFMLRSPVAGVVIVRDVMVGQAIGDNPTPLFKIANLSQLWLSVHAFERDAVRIGRTTSAQVTVAALPGRTIAGRVSQIGGQVDPESRTVPIRILVANPDGLLRPGMSASARLPIGDVTAQILTIPSGALQRLGDGWVVFIPKDAGHFEVREVGRGRDLEGQVEIVQGLQAGDRVVVDGSFVLKAEAEKARGLGGDDHH